MTEEHDAVDKLNLLVERLLDLGFDKTMIMNMALDDAINLYRLNTQLRGEA